MQTISTDCKKFKIAKEFLKKYNWPTNLNNPQYDRCYCKSCYGADLEDTFFVGGNTYVVPRGWTRIGVHIDEVISKHHKIWDNWSNCYHGTSIKSAKSIIEHRQMLLPGEETLAGKIISIREGHFKGQDFFFTTPTIKYAEHPAYASNYIFTAANKIQYNIKVVLQCKQKPGSITVQSETVGATRASKKICRFIPNDKVEWKTKQRLSIMQYGLLLQIEPIVEEDSTGNAVCKLPIKENLQVDCPHCSHSNIWIRPKENQDVVLTCKKKSCQNQFKAFNCPCCTTVNFICSCSKDFKAVCEKECSSKSCDVRAVHQKCFHCANWNIWGLPDKDKVKLVTCSSCGKESQLFKCPHCYWSRTSNVIVAKCSVQITCKTSWCLKSYGLTSCAKCLKLKNPPKKYCDVVKLKC